MSTTRIPLLQRKVILGFSFALLMLATIAFVSYRSIRSLSATVGHMERTREVLEKVHEVSHRLAELENAAAGCALVYDEVRLGFYREAGRALTEEMAALRALASADAEQTSEFETMRGLIEPAVARMEREVARTDGGGSASYKVFLSSRDWLDEKEALEKCTAQVLSSTREKLRAQGEISLRLGQVAGATIAVGGVLAIGIMLWAAWLLMRDMEARRQTEEVLENEHNLLRRVIDSIPEQVTVLDADGSCIVTNEAHHDVLKHKRPTAFGAEALHGEISAEEAGENRRIIQSGEPMLKEISVRETNGAMRWFSVEKVPFEDSEGKIVGTVAFTSDITAHKEAEQALLVTASQLHTRNVELQEFAAAASHDLQEPLRKVMAFGDRLRIKCHDALGEDGRDYLGRIINAAQRMQKLVEGLLTLARLSQRAASYEEVDLNKVFSEVVSDLEIRIEQSGAKVEAGALPTIEADALQMRQLFQNLISNALKFTKRDVAPLVKIGAIAVRSDGTLSTGGASNREMWRIEIEDNGIGFDEKFAERIFDPFIRLHGRNVYEGAGIGLALVRKIAERHGGSIRACGGEGRGAKFIVTLPAKQPNKEQNEQAR
jgi:PAS domain S-box-containing protein